jgi:hypothetical protein
MHWVFHQRTGGILVLLAHSRQAICDVQIQVFPHYDTRATHAITQESWQLSVALKSEVNLAPGDSHRMDW